MTKKRISLFLTLCLLLSLLPVSALEEGQTTQQDAVASTGTGNDITYYKTLDYAVSADAGEITLLKDAKLTASETTYTNVNINTNGHWIQVQKDAALTLKGSDTKISNKNSSADKPSIRVVGELTIEDGTYETTSSEFLIIWGTANIRGGTFSTTHTATSTTDGRGFFAVNGKDGSTPTNATLNMTSGSIEIKSAGTTGEAPHPISLFNGGSANLGTENGDGPTVTGKYLDIGMNNTLSPANVNILGGTYKTTSQASSGEITKFDAVAYLSAGGEFNIKGGTFEPYNGAAAFSVPYTNAAVKLNVSGGNIGGTKALYIGNQQGQGNGSPAISITGGTFTEAYQTEPACSYKTYIAEGYEAQKNSDDTWTVGKKCTVTFDLQEGTGNIPAQTVLSGNTANEPAAPPTREHYTFGGWYTDAACKVKYDFNQAVTGDITLYAQWTPIPVKTVTLKLLVDGTPTDLPDDGVKLSISEDESAESTNTATLTAVIAPTDALDQSVVWTSSDGEVATVDNGTITAKGVGTAAITAAVGEKSASCSVTVNTLAKPDEIKVEIAAPSVKPADTNGLTGEKKELADEANEAVKETPPATGQQHLKIYEIVHKNNAILF